MDLRWQFPQRLAGKVARVLAWTITMLSLLPVEGTTRPIVLAWFGIGDFVLWALSIFIHGLRIQLGRPSTRRNQVLGGFILASIALFFGITYGLGADLTIAARYHCLLSSCNSFTRSDARCLLGCFYSTSGVVDGLSVSNLCSVPGEGKSGRTNLANGMHRWADSRLESWLSKG